MRVKKYRAASLPDALRAVKRDLGADAVIVHSQRVQRGGVLGLFGQDAVEVVAAVDNAAYPGTREELPHPVPLPEGEGTRPGVVEPRKGPCSPPVPLAATPERG